MAEGGLPEPPDLLLPPDPGEAPPAWAPPIFGVPPMVARLLGGDGLGAPLRLQLHQAEDSLSRARARWLRLELLWRLLEELIREPRELRPQVVQSLEQALTQARLRQRHPEMAEMVPEPQPFHLLPGLLPELQRRLREKRESIHEFLLGTPKIPQNPPKNPPKNPQNPQNPQIHPKTAQKNPKIPPKMPQNRPKTAPKNPKILPENPPRNRQNFAQNPQNSAQNPKNSAQNPQNFLENPENLPENPESAEISPKIAQNLGDLGAELRRERLRERRLRAELEKAEVEYPQVLRRCLSRLSQLRLQVALQARLDGGRGRYLLAKGEALLLKCRLEQLQILLDTYPAPTVEAHRRIRAELSEARSAAQAEAAKLGAELAAVRELGPEFRELALELGRIRQELEQKRRVLRQLRPQSP